MVNAIDLCGLRIYANKAFAKTVKEMKGGTCMGQRAPLPSPLLRRGSKDSKSITAHSYFERDQLWANGSPLLRSGFRRGMFTLPL